MAVRYYTVGPNIIKKRKQRGNDTDDGDIQIDMSVELARQASELSRISQAYADDTALAIASRLSQSSQISSTLQQQVNTTTTVTQELAQYSATVNQNVEQIISTSDSVKYLSEAIANWPLYTSDLFSYANRFRDESLNSIDLVVSGTESSYYGVVANQGFYNYSPAFSGLRCSLYDNMGEPVNIGVLINAVDADISYITMNENDPFSIEFLYRYGNSTSNGYIINFGEQYQIKVVQAGYGDSSDKMSFVIGGNETNSAIDLSSLSTDTWSHYAFSYDPIEKSVTAYKDGKIQFKDTNVGTPGPVPTDSKVKVFENCAGYLNNLRIYKATISNSTVISLYNSYKTKNLDFQTGSVFASNHTGGNYTKLIDTTHSVINGFNVGRSLFTNQVGFPSKTVAISDTYNVPSATANYGFNYLGTTISYTLIGFDYVKLPGETNINLFGTLSSVTNPCPTVKYLFLIRSADAGVSYSPVFHSGLITHGTTATNINIGFDISDAPDLIAYNIELRMANFIDTHNDTVLSAFNIFAMNQHSYNNIGAGSL